jgi:hypothetical protein
MLSKAIVLKACEKSVQINGHGLARKVFFPYAKG